jgi:dCTP diphosphatase
MSDIRELQKAVIDFRDKRDWKQFHNPKDITLSLVLEAAELMEHFQWKNEAEINRHIEKNKLKISEELADVLYWVLLIGNDFDIDLPNALISKLKKNEKSILSVSLEVTIENIRNYDPKIDNPTSRSFRRTQALRRYGIKSSIT